ncbi:uncharacterized protein LOC122505397 isoform X2 [Leptopilina heterotoma]|uniref:uncharacterized protein LOC122505397 isoform X2 n=1 Tax=Leptopilina heterotoma TaxID=63436 RepID=UPI001CAA399D|nr:uncharacterized protein LOC122505397 isoform X2 [Leptopilina heterotoma]
MRGVMKSFIIFLVWAVEVNSDTFEVLTVPYEQLFPKGPPQGSATRHRQQHNMPNFNQYYPKYPHQQRPYTSNTDWVCRNPSTGDMLIISSDNFRFENNNLRPTPPTSTTVKYPTNPFLPVTPSIQSPLNCNSYPKHPMCGEVGIIETTTFQTPEKKANTSGEGLIDVK